MYLCVFKCTYFMCPYICCFLFLLIFDKMSVFQLTDHLFIAAARAVTSRSQLELGNHIRQFNNIDFSSEVSTVHKFVYTDEALLLVRE